MTSHIDDLRRDLSRRAAPGPWTRKSPHMFIVLLNYIKPLSEVDRFVEEHRQFLQRHYAAGNFLLSGRKEPRTGGVILATAGTRAEIERIIEDDPFRREKVAEYEIIEFLPSMSAEHLAHLVAP
jgi:uncharacterized protein YciI